MHCFYVPPQTIPAALKERISLNENSLEEVKRRFHETRSRRRKSTSSMKPTPTRPITNALSETSGVFTTLNSGAHSIKDWVLLDGGANTHVFKAPELLP